MQNHQLRFNEPEIKFWCFNGPPHAKKQNGGIYVSASPLAGVLRHINMAWPCQRASASVQIWRIIRARKSAPRAASAFLWTEFQDTRTVVDTWFWKWVWHNYIKTGNDAKRKVTEIHYIWRSNCRRRSGDKQSTAHAKFQYANTSAVPATHNRQRSWMLTRKLLTE